MIMEADETVGGMLCRRKGGRAAGTFSTGLRDHMVEEVVEQWYGPDDVFFKVRTDDGNLYILRRGTSADGWTLESFRHLKD